MLVNDERIGPGLCGTIKQFTVYQRSAEEPIELGKPPMLHWTNEHDSGVLEQQGSTEVHRRSSQMLQAKLLVPYRKFTYYCNFHL
jgi:hypothetical protein